MIDIQRLDAATQDFDARLAALLDRAPETSREVTAAVDAIVTEVRARGDAALIELTNRYDRRSLRDAAELEVPRAAWMAAWDGLDARLRTALEAAAERIRAYAQYQKLGEFEFTDAHGNRLGQRITALERVGLYVPGGKAAYPSSVLMNAIPAKVAGVEQIIMVVPAPGGELNPIVLAAAHLVGVDRVFTLGGAQAVAALAYGTQTVPMVDKIVGPGNAFVAAAKRAVFGQVGIDSIAGPSEIVVISDAGSDPDWIAMDLFSQAEHGEDSESILISPDQAVLDAVAAAMARRVASMPRADTILASLRLRGALIKVRDLDEACAVANRIAPEHLELAVDAPQALVPKIRHAGAIFLGRHTPEAIGDYCAGPNHVLPTARAARFSNPLGVYEFQKRSTLIQCTPAGAKPLAQLAATLADAEGLQAHAQSARDRAGS